MSATWRPDRNDPSTWVELFSPDSDCTVDELVVEEIRLVDRSRSATAGRSLDPRELVRIVEQQPNADYPRTIPRSGSGKGHIIGWLQEE
jgi:hypothetical protein